MPDTPDLEESPGLKGGSMVELCQTLCRLVKSRNFAQEIEDCSAAILELCDGRNGFGGRGKLSLKSFVEKGSPELAELVSAIEVPLHFDRRRHGVGVSPATKVVILLHQLFKIPPPPEKWHLLQQNSQSIEKPDILFWDIANQSSDLVFCILSG